MIAMSVDRVPVDEGKQYAKWGQKLPGKRLTGAGDRW